MGAVVLLVALLALAVPSSFVWIGTQTLTPMLGVIMFGMGLTLAPADKDKVRLSWSMVNDPQEPTSRPTA